MRVTTNSLDTLRLFRAELLNADGTPNQKRAGEIAQILLNAPQSPEAQKYYDHMMDALQHIPLEELSGPARFHMQFFRYPNDLLGKALVQAAIAEPRHEGIAVQDASPTQAASLKIKALGVSLSSADCEPIIADTLQAIETVLGTMGQGAELLTDQGQATTPN